MNPNEPPRKRRRIDDSEASSRSVDYGELSRPGTSGVQAPDDDELPVYGPDLDNDYAAIEYDPVLDAEYYEPMNVEIPDIVEPLAAVEVPGAMAAPAEVEAQMEEQPEFFSNPFGDDDPLEAFPSPEELNDRLVRMQAQINHGKNIMKNTMREKNFSIRDLLVHFHGPHTQENLRALLNKFDLDFTLEVLELVPSAFIRLSDPAIPFNVIMFGETADLAISRAIGQALIELREMIEY